MRILEITCAIIVALYLAMRLHRGPDQKRVLVRLLLLSISSFVGEDSVIHAYGFYQYSPGWSLFLDRVPLLIVVIWPIVIDSAWQLARHLLGAGHRAIPLAAGAFVLADASLIEPIAVQAGLWSWNEPGLFAVPPIGILGWAFFAFAAVTWLEHREGARLPALADLAVIPIAPAATHALLLATWWGALRWVNGPVPAWPAVALAWVLLSLFALRAFRARMRRRVPPIELWVRVPAALFFFVLLGLHGRDVAPLVAYAIAFAPPYLSLIDWRAAGASRPAGEE